MHDKYIPNHTVIAATRGIGKSMMALNYMLWVMQEVERSGCLLIHDKTLIEGMPNDEERYLYELSKYTNGIDKGSLGYLLMG
jgi:hypothetical protein